MARNELQKLKRRELLKMLLIQAQETERLEKELNEITVEHEMMMESYERLKSKLNVKDERLNQKDAQIAELRNTIAEMKRSRMIELEDAGSIAEAALRLNGVFEAAQKAAEQYLMNVKRIGGLPPDIPDTQPETKGLPASDETEWRAGISASDKTGWRAEISAPDKTGWRAGIRKKPDTPRIRQMVTFQTGADVKRCVTACRKDGEKQRVLAAVSGGVHG